MQSPALTGDLRRAGPLSDPVRSLSTLIIVTTALTFMSAVIGAVRVLASGVFGEGALVRLLAVLVVVGTVTLPLAMWLLLQPGRRAPVFYLRAFRSDAESATVRRLIRAALGQTFRLCGIRPPNEQSAWYSRLFLVTATGLSYLGSEQFDLEASDYNWMARLLASYTRARLVFVDVRDITVNVAQEIAVSYAAMGAGRCIFLTDGSHPEAVWRDRIATLAGTTGVSSSELRVLCFKGGSPAESADFVHRAVDLVRRAPEDLPDVSRAVPIVRACVPAASWPTPWLEKDWPLMIAGSAIVSSISFIAVSVPSAPVVLRAILVGLMGLLGLVGYFYYLRALGRQWRDARSLLPFRDVVGGPNPLWRVRVVACMSVVGLLFLPAVPVAVALPGLMQARMVGNEVSAMATLRLLNAAQAMFAATCGNGAYAPRVTVLASAPSAGEVPFVPADLGTSDSPLRAGYTFALRAALESAAGPKDCLGRPTITAWFATAAPLTLGKTGSRAFAVTTNGTIWQVRSANPPTEPLGPPAVPIE